MSSFSLFLYLLIVLSSCQSIPQIQPVNNTLGSNTDYILNYFSLKDIPSTTIFTIDLSTTQIHPTQGTIPCTAYLNNVQVSSPVCECSGESCSLKPNQSASNSTKVMIQFSGLTNPMYLSTQRLNVNIYFNPSITQENYDISIPYNAYKPMNIIVNDFIQSDYGVGSTPVSYIFNISLYYISENFQLQIQIPDEVGSGSITSQISFYGTVQNISPFQFQNLIIFNIITPEIINPDGYMLLNLTGFANPQYIGNSSSFTLVFQQTSGQSNCATCKIAELTTGLLVQSKTPGDIKILSITSTNLYVATLTTFTVSFQLYAGVPEGGQISIQLPTEIQPALPITCNNIYGFTLTDDKSPHCSYDAATHSIYTENFASPYDIDIGNAIISIDIYNAEDTRAVEFQLQTTDEQGRTIGKTRTPRSYSAIPIAMNLTLSKSNVEVSTLFNLTCQITLQRNLSQSNTIQVIFPSAVAYDLQSIQCISASTNLNCSPTLNSIQQLVVTMLPPCVECSTGNSIKFTVNNVRNPSYINENMEVIYIHTKSQEGIIEGAEQTISLSPTSINIASYNKPYNLQVGASYELTVSFTPPDYVVEEGGQLQLIFDENAVYTDIVTNDEGYELSYSLNIKDSNNNPYTNNVQYYTSLTPKSISKIFFNICQNEGCTAGQSLNLTISGLKQAYKPGMSTTDTLKVCTLIGEQIGHKEIDTSASAAVLISDSLTISAEQSVTNTRTQYSFVWAVEEVVIDQIVELELGLGQEIEGVCRLSMDQQLSGSYLCEKVTDRKIKLTMDFDQTQMISKNITYTLTIDDVSTPTSMAPLQYHISTTFQSVINQQFKGTYSMAQPYPLEATHSKSNNTINQQCTLAISISPKQPNYAAYNIEISNNLLVIERNAIQELGLTFAQNSTVYLLSSSAPISDNTINIPCKNTLATSGQGHIVITTLDNGYNMEKTNIIMAPNDPITLGISISSDNQTVGQNTTLTITIDRNNDGWLGETTLLLTLTNGYNYEHALYNNSPIPNNMIINVPVLVSSDKVMQISINNAENLPYVPDDNDVFTPVKVAAVKDEEVVGEGENDVHGLLSAFALQVAGLAANRNNTKTGNITSITLDYDSVLGQDGDIIEVLLPAGQNQFMPNCGCSYILASQSTPCMIYQSNSTNIKFGYHKDTTFTLTNILNQHPNSNNLSLTLFTFQSNLVEKSSASIIPSIELEQLHIQTSPTNAKVGEISTLVINLTSVQLPIQAEDKLEIVLPTQTFTRELNTDDCEIQVAANNYTGCSYEVDDDDWLVRVVIPSLTPFTIAVNSSIIIRLPVTNAWTTYPFNDKTITFTLYNHEGSTLSAGIQSLVQMFPSMTTFQTQPIQSTSLSQSSTSAGSLNNISLNVSVSGNYRESCEFVVMVPKDTYTMNSGDYYKQDSMYYYWKESIDCGRDVCLGSYEHVWVIAVQNNYYIKNERNKIMGYMVDDTYPVSQFLSIQPPIYTAHPLIDLTLTRHNSHAYEPSSITVTFSLHQSFQTLNINISNYLSTITTITSSSTDINNYLHASQQLQIDLSNVQSQVELEISGKNSLLVPDEELLSIIIYNQTHTLYEQNNVQFNNKLIPYTDGLSIQRENTTVGVSTALTLEGELPDVAVVWEEAVVEAIGQQYSGINSNSFTVALQPYRNPQNINSQETVEVIIRIPPYTLYQNKIPISPSLTPIINTGTNIAVTIPTQSQINSTIKLKINFDQPQPITRFALTTAMFYNQVVSCVGTHQQQQTINGCNLASETNTNSISLQANEKLIDELVVRVRTIPYQTTFSNADVKVEWENPSTVFQTTNNINIYGVGLDTNISSTSYKTRATANYSISVSAVKASGELQVILPPIVSSQMPTLSYTITSPSGEIQAKTTTNDDTFTFIIATSPTTNNFIINIQGVQNAEDNEPQTFTFIQHQPSQESKIYAHDTDSLTMEELDPVYITEAERNTSKISSPVAVALIIQTPLYEDTIFIQLPQAQVVILDTQCRMQVDGAEQQCQFVGDNTVRSEGRAGTHNYTLHTVKNADYSTEPTQQDKVRVYLGSPYKKAESQLSTSVFITPLIVTGSIQLQKFESTSSTKATYTDLHLTLTLENWNKIDGFLFHFSDFSYFLHPNMQITINQQQCQYTILDKNSLFIQVTSDRAPTIKLSINKVINYLQDGTFTITSVKKKDMEPQQEDNGGLRSHNENLYDEADYGVLDFYQSGSGLVSLKTNSPSIRVILPNNYVSAKQTNVLVLNDESLPSEIPTKNLYYRIQSQQLSCSSKNITFNASITFSCKLTKSGKASLTISLHDSSLPSTTLTTTTSTIYIYPQPSDHCSDPLCDFCSDDYCFICREDLHSDNGSCVEQCSSSLFPYEGVCVQCSPSCLECYDLYDDTCLQCQDDNLLLDSGECTQSCSTGFENEGRCVSEEQCSTVEGCRVCSTSGFCYECLPDYEGQPFCQFQDLLPPTLFVFFLIPLALLFLSCPFAVACKSGCSTVPNAIIFYSSLLQFFTWIFTVPKIGQQVAAMVLCSLIVIKIIISIVSYETYYNKHLDKQKQVTFLKRQSEDNSDNPLHHKQQPISEGEQLNQVTCKERIGRFFAHFLSCDAYELFSTQFGQPYLTITHHNVYMALSIIHRALVMIFMGWAITLATTGDSLFLPLVAIGSGGIICLIRWIRSGCMQACCARMRN